VLALRLARILAIHRRVLYGSENHLWDEVSREMGAAWGDAQAAALAIRGETLDVSSKAALRLFQLVVDETRPLLNERQYAVVAHALREPQA
jgi:hypothetical protein